MFSLDTALGIEISGDDLCVAMLSRGFRDVSLRGACRVENFHALTPQQLREELERRLPPGALKTERVVLGLPRERVIARNVELPLEVEENLDQVVKFQIERYEPVESEASCFDYSVLRRDEKNKRLSLQMMMVPAAVLDDAMAVIEGLNLYPAAVRASTHSLQQLLQVHADGMPKKAPALILDIEGDSVGFVLVHGPGKADSQRVTLPAEPSFEAIVTQLQLFISELDPQEEALSKIYISGDASDEIVKQFGASFGDCERLADSLRLNLDRDGEACLNAIGLALTGFARSGGVNLLPKERRVVREAPSWIPTAALAGILLVLTGAAAARGFIQNDRLLSDIEERVSQLQPEVQETMSLRSDLDARQARVQELSQLMVGRQTVLNILRELTEMIPEDTYLESLTVQGDTIGLTGYADRASSLLTILIESDCLQGVEQKYILPGVNNKEKFRFEAKAGPCGSR